MKKQAFPKVAAGTIRAPLLVAGPYLLLTYLMFFLAPYEWPVREWWVLYAYIPLAFALLALGFLISTQTPGRFSETPSLRGWYVFGALAAILMLFPTAQIYTGKWPWDIAAALADQKEAYSALAQQLQETEGGRAPIALLRALLAPFSFCVVPVAILHWKKFTKPLKALAFATVFVSVDLSILRGTTRELADLVIVGASAFLVTMGRTSVVNGTSLSLTLRKRWKIVALLPLAVMVVVMALLGRTEARMDGKNAICLSNSGVCISSSEPYRSLSDTALFGLATVSGYLSQGYYGLTLAAEKPFLSTYGIGHSPALSALYVRFSGDPLLVERAYTSRARADGWSDETQWSGLLTWIANDVGFIGALIFVLALGGVWGRAWINATQGNDDKAGVFFCALMMMVFYFPANNQMMATFDNYAIILFWGFANLFARRQLVSFGPRG